VRALTKVHFVLSAVALHTNIINVQKLYLILILTF